MLVSYLAIIGYGKIITATFFGVGKNHELLKYYKSIEFIIGLLFIGSFSILYNFLFPINDFYSVIVILLGCIFFISFFLQYSDKKKEIIIVISITLLASFFSYYSLSNDDFNYHFKTIANFKNFSIIHDLVLDEKEGRRYAYNSHWLMLTSVFYIIKFPQTLYTLISLIYLLSLYDFYKTYRRNYNSENFLVLSYSALIFIFLLGVLNQYKEFGTDLPGQILILLIFLFYFETNISQKNNKDISSLLLITAICFFAVMLKISNILVLLLVFFLFLNCKKRFLFFLKSILIAIPFYLWVIQNYFISKCLIWPISSTCFQNSTKAQSENLIIELSAKKLLDLNFTPEQYHEILNNFSWISYWFINFFPKYLETYFIYFFIFILTYLIFLVTNKKNFTNQRSSFLSFFKININNKFFIFSLISIICFVFWFIKAPDYRFGIVYNLNLLLIILVPICFNIAKINQTFFTKSIKTIFIIAFLFFIYSNYIKFVNYNNKFEKLPWPNIIERKYIN